MVILQNIRRIKATRNAQEDCGAVQQLGTVQQLLLNNKGDFKVYKFIGILVLGIINIFLYGFVLSVLWEWFIVSEFGVKTISIQNAAGITLIINLLTSKADQIRNKDTTEIMLMGYLIPVFALGIGWIITLI